MKKIIFISVVFVFSLITFSSCMSTHQLGHSNYESVTHSTHSGGYSEYNIGGHRGGCH